MALLSENKVLAWIKSANGWHLSGPTISKTFTLKSFIEALQFVNKIGELAEAADHHPDILLHQWNLVTITLSTHSAGGLTEKDINLAEQIEAGV